MTAKQRSSIYGHVTRRGKRWTLEAPSPARVPVEKSLAHCRKATKEGRRYFKGQNWKMVRFGGKRLGTWWLMSSPDRRKK